MQGTGRNPTHLYLEKLQKARYKRLGTKPPVYDKEAFLQLKQRNMEVLRAGGVMEQSLASLLDEQGLPPAEHNEMWAGMQELLDHARKAQKETPDEAFGEVIAEYKDVPTPHVQPSEHSILKRINRSIALVDNLPPRYDLAGLARRTTVSTLPMPGRVNASVLSVPGTDEYLLLVDPVYFAFMKAFSADVANAIRFMDRQGTLQVWTLRQYIDNLKDLLQVDGSIAERFVWTLASFVRFGKPGWEFPLETKFEIVAAQFCEQATLFLLAHEYSHILLGHFEEETRDRTDGAETSSPIRLSSIAPSFREHEADYLATDIVNAVMSKDGRWPPERSFWGIDFSFLSVMLVDLARCALDTGKFGSLRGLIRPEMEGRGALLLPKEIDHPEFIERWGQVHGWLKMNRQPALYAEIEQWATLLLQTMDQLWHVVYPRFNRLHHHGERASSHWQGYELFEI